MINYKKVAICNLVTDRYAKGQERLKESLQANLGSLVDECFYFRGEDKVGAPRHQDNPYAFKIYTIDAVRNMGFDIVFWLDASVFPIKPVDPVIEVINQNGIFFEEAGHFAGRWCNEATLKYFNIIRNEADFMPMYSAGFSGFDFTNSVAIEFYRRWKASMIAGCFIGSWEDHRHDMTCGSIIANQMNIVDLYQPGGKYFAYIGDAYGTPKESVIFHVQGMV